MLFLLFSSCAKPNETEIVLIPPVNIYPLQTERINANNFYARWTKSVSNEDRAVTYLFSYSRSIEDLAKSFAYETKNNYFLLPHLESGVWYWQVKARLNDKSINSPIWSFTVESDGLPVPKDPRQIPTDPLLIVGEIGDNGFSLDWNEYIDPLYPSNEISYTINLYEDNGQISHRSQLNTDQIITILSRSEPVTTAVTTNTNYLFNSLKANSSYIWSLIAGADASRTTAVGNGGVRTGNSVPTLPVLLSPSHNATEVATDVTLDWTESTDPDGDDFSYFVYIDTYPNNTQSETMNGFHQTSFQPKGLKAGRTYYWSILVKDAHGAATLTQTRQFKTKSLGGINVPKTPTPADRSGNVNALNPPLLEWEHDKNDKAITYTVYLSTNAMIMEQQAEQTTDQHYQIPRTLKSNTLYYWQVEAVDVQTGHSALSDIWTFTTGEIEPPLQTHAHTNREGTQIELTYDKPMKDPKDKQTQYIVKRGSGVDQEGRKEETIFITDIILSSNASNIYILSLERPILHNDIITMDYIQGNIQAQDGSFLENYANKEVFNTVPGANPICTGATMTADGKTVKIGFSQEMETPTQIEANQFGILVNGHVNEIESAALAEDKHIINLTLDKPIGKNNQVHLSYMKGTVGSVNGGLLESFQNKPVDTDPLNGYWITKGIGWNYSSIQDAIDASTNGDSITVSMGVYKENLTIENKRIHLRSDDPASETMRRNTVIDAGANGNPGIEIIESDTRGSKRSQEKTIIEGLTITNASGTSSQSFQRSPAMTSGIAIIGASPIIRHNIICGNTTDYYGGGILIENLTFGSEQRLSVEKNQPQIYSNTIENNHAKKGGGIYVDADSLVLNADGNPWKWFNAPETAEDYVEGNTDEQLNNTYQNNSLLEPSDSQDTVSDGANICFEQIDTPEGMLTLRPETAIEQSNVTLHIDYVIGTSFHGGSITIQVPDEFTIGNNASVTIGDETKSSDEYTPEATTITITGINLEEGTITMKLKEQEVPTGLSTQSGERNISYDFKAVSDADGNGSTWRTSEESIECFTSTPLSINTNFMLNDNNPQLIQIEITDTATEIKVASGTAVEVVLSDIESADGSNQEYRIYDSSADSMEGRTELTEPATLVVFSERGETYQEEYAIAINPTPFVKLDSVSENFQSLKQLNRPESNYSETWHNSIAIAVASANNSEPSTITVWPATYPEDEMEIVGKQLAIKSIDENSFTIDLEGKECRAFNITSTASVTIQNAIIQNGQPTDGQGGGAIRLDNSKLHIENSTITNNITPLYGGALSVENESVLTMIGCSLFGNKATADSDSDQMGGSIFLEKGYFYATNTTVENNEAGRYGGGLFFLNNGECVLENCTVTNNSAVRDGGGIYISSAAFNFIGKKINVTSNRAKKGGGMLFTGNSSFRLYETVFKDNLATTSGGGLYLSATGTIHGCTITSNYATEDGGGIYVSGDKLTAVDSFIFENRADRNGGGIYFYWAEGTINETIIRANNADNGSGVYIVKSYDSTKDIVTENINWINDIGSQLENIGIAPKESNGAVNYATGVVYEENILNDYSVVITDNSTDTGNNQLHIEQ